MSHNETVATGQLAVSTRRIIWTVFGAAVLICVTVLVVGISTVIADLIDGRVSMTLIAEHELRPGADQGTASIASGNYETASVLVRNLSATPVALVAISALVGTLTQVAVVASVAILAWRLLRSRPFHPSLSGAITIAGAALLIGGLLSSGLHSFGAMMTADELNVAGIAAGEGYWPLAAAIDPVPIALGFVFMLVGFAFEHGEKLQRDTEGLI